MSNRQCTIPITVLRASPFLLGNLSGVNAYVIASNVIGDSSVSSSGNGATLPIWDVSSVPQNLARDNA
jgi:hypothetical protein